MAVYVGMTPDEAKEYDDCRRRITQLIQELAALELAQ
jgi:7-cyano-7-deazaguanine synthase in queuosine biosynthesis